MAKKEVIKDREGNVVLPITSTECVLTSSGKSLKEMYATKQYADEAAADILNSSPEQLQVINTLGLKLGDDENIANAVTKTVADSKKQLFIDMWKARGDYRANLPSPGYAYMELSDYNPETDKFILNEMEFDYEEAMLIYQASLPKYCQVQTSANYGNLTYGHTYPRMKTLFPMLTFGNNYFNWMYQYCTSLVNIRLLDGYGGGFKDNQGVQGTFNSIFYGCFLLERVLSALQPNENINDGAFQGCDNLYELKIQLHSNKKSVNSIDLRYVPKWSLESVRYMIDNKTSDWQVTVTVHSDVYSKLTDINNTEWYQANQDALNKQITFITV